MQGHEKPRRGVRQQPGNLLPGTGIFGNLLILTELRQSLNAIQLRKAPKGRVDTARGKALGIQDKKAISHERANYAPGSFLNAPFQGFPKMPFP
jgi:hypothetical protein